MSRPRARKLIDCPRDPIGLSSEEAATFIGISESLFQSAVDAGSLPSPRQLGGRLIWDAEEVAVAFRRLPRKGAANQNEISPDRWSPRA